jgi:hypothetical protein
LFVTKRINKFEAGVGLSMFHMNDPKATFYANNNRLPIRYLINIDLKYYLNEKVILNVHTLYGTTTTATDWLSGATAEYVLSRGPFYTNSVFAGFIWRDGLQINSDAVIPTFGFRYKAYTFGMSYDINISKLHTATDYKGAMEFALIYTGKNTRLVKKQIACDRY